MNALVTKNMLGELQQVLDQRPALPVAQVWRALASPGIGPWPQPGGGQTLARWRALSAVAQHDLSLAKLVEGHTDALAILQELGHPSAGFEGALWSTWASDGTGSRVLAEPAGAGRLVLTGTKPWCPGAEVATHALITVWRPDTDLPQLAAVGLHQSGVGISSQGWRAVGMADSASADVRFSRVSAVPVGAPGDYRARPGFWHGAAGVAACWLGGATALGMALRAALETLPPAARTPFRQAALGRVDLALSGSAALLREAAAWIDAHPAEDAGLVALRVRQGAEAASRRVLDDVGRALGATPFCRDPRFARPAADLPVFIRQSHADRDDAAVGERLLSGGAPAWTL